MSEPFENSPGNTGYRCRDKGRGDKTRLLDYLPEEERNQWLPRTPLRSQFVAVDLFAHGCSVELARKVTGITLDNLYFLFYIMIDLIAPWMEIQNDNERAGGDQVQCEADEIALRCVAGVNEEGVPGSWWIRYFGLIVRGQYRVILKESGDKFAPGDGRGGEGPISDPELVAVLKSRHR